MDSLGAQDDPLVGAPVVAGPVGGRGRQADRVVAVGRAAQEFPAGRGELQPR